MQVEAVADADAGLERALGRGLDHRAVGDRIGERNSDLDHVRAAFDQRIEQPRAGCEIGIAEHQECAERALAPRAGRTWQHSGSCRGPSSC